MRPVDYSGSTVRSESMWSRHLDDVAAVILDWTAGTDDEAAKERPGDSGPWPVCPCA
jgi:hypothetical protein